jgi:hypothetical protein
VVADQGRGPGWKGQPWAGHHRLQLHRHRCHIQ